MRKGELTVNGGTIDALLKVNDQVRLMMEDIRNGLSPEYDLAPFITMLEGCDSAPPVVPSPAVTADPAAPAPLLPSSPQAESVETASASRIADVPDQKAARASARPDPSDTMRVEIRKLDYLVKLVGELVLERNRLLRLSQDLAKSDGKNLTLTEGVATSTARLSFITDELQNASLRTRMVPIDNVFRKLPRLVRELSHQVGKEVEISITGQEPEIDKTMIEHIHDRSSISSATRSITALKIPNNGSQPARTQLATSPSTPVSRATGSS